MEIRKNDIFDNEENKPKVSQMKEMSDIEIRICMNYVKNVKFS